MCVASKSVAVVKATRACTKRSQCVALNVVKYRVALARTFHCCSSSSWSNATVEYTGECVQAAAIVVAISHKLVSRRRGLNVPCCCCYFSIFPALCF